MNLRRLFRVAPRSYSSLLLIVGHAQGWSATGARVFRASAAGILPAAFLLISKHDQIYNILWALVFGFATINILSLGARRFEANKSGLNFGEVLAILIVVLSIILLGWEMLYLFHILPIHLAPR
jgi:hypothetical protein